MFTAEEETVVETVVEVPQGRCEVAVQWERPEEQWKDAGVQWERPEEQWKDAGVQSSAENADVAVQVDLIGLSCRMPGSCDVPWHCVSVRAEEPAGGALWQHCSSQNNNNNLLCSPPALSSALLCPSPTRTPDQEPDSTHQHTLPSMHQSAVPVPSMHQAAVSVPSMPFCGDSPTASDRLSPDVLESLGFMAPLSSDEEEPNTPLQDVTDEQFHETNPPIKRRRGRPSLHKNYAQNPTTHDAQSSSDTETKKCKRRSESTNQTAGSEDFRPRRKTAGLPVRYQLDYDLESHGPIPANQETESAEGEEQEGTKEKGAQETDKKPTEKMLFLPYYKKSLNLSEFAEYQNLSKWRSRAERSVKNKQEEEMNPPIVMRPGFEHFMPHPLPPDKILSKDKLQNVKLNVDKKPQLLPLKLKRVIKTKSVKSRPLVPKKNPDWLIENKTIKEEEIEDENPDLRGSDWSKVKTITGEDVEETDGTQSEPASNASSDWLKRDVKPTVKAPDWSKYKRIIIKQEITQGTQDGASDWSKSRNQVLKMRRRRRRNTVGSSKDVKMEGDEENGQLVQVTAENWESVNQWHRGIKRRGRRGRPRNGEINREDHEFKRRLEFVSTEQPERPRRMAVGPPIRYLLESEELQSSPEGQRTGRRGRRRKFEVPEWGGPLEMSDGCEEDGQSGEVEGERSSQTTGGYEDRERALAYQDGARTMSAPGRDKLKLEDVAKGSEVEGSLVKRVKILNMDARDGDSQFPDSGQPEIIVFDVKEDLGWMVMVGQEAQTERENGSENDAEITYEYEDIENLYVLGRGEEEIQRSNWNQDDKTQRRLGKAKRWKPESDGEGGKAKRWKPESDGEGGKAKRWKPESDGEGGNQWETLNGGRDRESANGERRRRGRRRRRRECEDANVDSKGEFWERFLVYRDVDTGATTLVPPCSVQLQRLT